MRIRGRYRTENENIFGRMNQSYVIARIRDETFVPQRKVVSVRKGLQNGGVKARNGLT